MRVVVGGASGFLGSHLVSELTGRGHTVTKLVRRAPGAADESRWDPASGQVDAEVVAAADVVVNLAGAPTAGNPHSKTWATELRASRVSSTSTLAEAIAASERPAAFLAGNGISYYGDRGADRLPETADSRGHALLTEVTREWEAAAAPARAAGARVCVLRTAPVMDARSQPLKALRVQFRLGLGGRLGSGEQYFPMISLRDWVGAVAHLAEHDDAAGAFNLCCPITPTNAEFTKALGRAVGRPTVIPAPSFAIRLGAGDMSPELLGSRNAVPQALVDAGYEFRDEDVTAVLAAGLAQRS
ncbi:TIGR01777 family oxidoreductase [Nocardioides cynanchi]|uniref:TIGR01777 family oxidoreductase n=1 Tax=Nocardioides cynanchi TaxID=2558918 RepID=UPI0012492D71|nr:TIGR01777 family oxidoreductase [Nocardioides cynanchi]